MPFLCARGQWCVVELKAENDRKQREIDELRARLAAIEAAVRRMEEEGK